MMKVSPDDVCWSVLEKAVHDAFDNVSEYDELEDNFIFLANEGQVAILPAEPAEREDNRDVQILQPEEDEEEKALREYR